MVHRLFTRVLFGTMTSLRIHDVTIEFSSEPDNTEGKKLNGSQVIRQRGKKTLNCLEKRGKREKNRAIVLLEMNFRSADFLSASIPDLKKTKADIKGIYCSYPRPIE